MRATFAGQSTNVAFLFVFPYSAQNAVSSQIHIRYASNNGSRCARATFRTTVFRVFTWEKFWTASLAASMFSEYRGVRDWFPALNDRTTSSEGNPVADHACPLSAISPCAVQFTVHLCTVHCIKDGRGQIYKLRLLETRLIYFGVNLSS